MIASDRDTRINRIVKYNMFCGQKEDKAREYAEQQLAKGEDISILGKFKDDYGREEWQSKRCLTLTKYVEPDGTTSYFDSEYAMTVDLSAPSQTFKSYWDSNINKLMQKLFPITMPYNVTNHPIAYIKSTEDALYHNIFELVYVVVYTGSNCNCGMKIDIGKYYKGTEEISYTEYLRCISSI